MFIRILLLCFAVIISVNCVSQNFSAPIAAIINDKDGYSNVRESASINSRVIYEIVNNHVFWVFEDYATGKDWYLIGYYKDSMVDSRTRPDFGYIHISRIQLISKLNKFKEKETSDKTKTFILANKELEIKLKQFSVNDHVISEDKRNGFLIDGQRPWGYDLLFNESTKPVVNTDNKYLNEIEHIKIILNNKEQLLPRKFYQGIFYVNMYNLEVFSNSKNIYFSMKNGSGGGSYAVVFVINSEGGISRYSMATTI